MPIQRLFDLLRGRLNSRYLYSDTFLGKFKSLDEALQAHSAYKHDTDGEGQFDPSFRTYCRVKDTIEGIPPNSVVLDVGCNSGGLGRRLIAEKRCVMYGVDINPRLVERAMSKGYDVYVGAAEDLRYPDGFFDVVVVSELLEHVYDPRLVLSEARRVLKPGGLLFGDVPTEIGRWGFETIRDHKHHARVFTRESLQGLLSEFFEVDYLKTAPAPGEDHPYFKVPTWYVFRCTRQ